MGIIFFAVTNLGFNSPYNPQMNKSFWLDAILSYNQGAMPSGIEDLRSDDVQAYTSASANLPNINTFQTTAFSDTNDILSAEDSLNLFEDSSGFINDTTDSVSDTLVVDQMMIDSTARLEHFRYQRKDQPFTRLGRKKESKFFIPISDKITRKIEIDSTGKYVEIKEMIAGQETKILLRMTIEEYIQLKLALRERELWEGLAYEYELQDDTKGLGDLIKDFTDFEIPLPSVGVLSIFGEPKIRLTIGGAVDIHGAWRNETTEGVTASRLGNTRNEPDFKQQVQINVSGTIGDKLNINADWNTERTFEYENQLKLKYTGYEDEIIQNIEAGNVSLQTSPLVGGSEALFGVKAQFKLGPLSLTTLASQKKGEIKEVSVTGGSTSQEFQKRAYEYSRNHFFVSSAYASTHPDSNYFNRYYDNPVPQVDETVKIVDMQVWKSVKTISANTSNERRANAFIDLDFVTSANWNYLPALRGEIDPIPGEREVGRFILLTEGIDYTYNPYAGFITLRTNVQEDEAVAVAYRVENDPNTTADDFYYGDFLTSPAVADTSVKLVLKLVKPSGLKPEYVHAWDLMLKNIYPLGGRNIKQEGFEFNIMYEIAGQDPATELPGEAGTVRLLEAFGLDKIDAAGNPNPDNVFDYLPRITIIPETGEIIFPHLQPFGEDLPPQLDTTYRYQEIYELTRTFASNVKAKDKWLLTGKYSGDATSVYQLGFNIVENSVKVILNGRELTPGVDYVVDYNIGQLTLRNDAALVPGADLRITYEQNDLFQLASKTLLGARGLFEFTKRTKLGFSILNLNQQTLSDKVRIGEEPLSNTIYGVDFSTSADLPFLTKALDNIISTREMSTFSVAGEFAYIDPDPNTKKSTVVSDQGKSIAYIDDFEGAKRVIPVGISYASWKDISVPDSLPYLQGLTNIEKMDYKGKSFWFTQTPAVVQVSQIYGDRKQVARADENVTVMDYVFMPDTPGTYNYHSRFDNARFSWGGIMKPLSSTANNLVEENIEFLEFWVNIQEAPIDARVYVDLGRISEDVIPNRSLDREDINNNFAYDEGEDTGIDGMTDAQERDPLFNPYINEPSTKADPSGDNFALPPAPTYPFGYFNINGTEGNSILTDISRLPDTEDLNNNGDVDLVNSYFRYEIPLDTNALTNPYIVGGGNGLKWYLFRVPLKDIQREIGSPSFSDVEMIRFFVTDAPSMVHLRFAEFNLVGNQWYKTDPDDTIMAVSVINVEDNPEYTIPPGVERERDRTRPDEDIIRNEQSLNLIIQELPEGESREAVKYLFRPLDVFNYSEMKLFIHGDVNVGHNSISVLPGQDPHAEVYFRFGSDTNNYYEYKQPIIAGWNEISIEFPLLTAIKEARTDSIQIPYQVPVEGRDGHFYVVRGRPSLTAVKFLAVGIKNTDDPRRPRRRPISGQVWVNELRVIGADDQPGWAYSMSSSLRMADLMTVNFNMSQTDPYFHKLADRFGSRIEQRNWSVQSDLDVMKLLPISLPESSLKINYSHTESVGKPLYLPGTDVRVSEAARLQEERRDSLIENGQTVPDLVAESQTVNVSDSWSASNIKIRIPTSFWLIRDSFNALTFGFNYNRTFSRNPTVLSNKAWVWNANMNYGINISPDYHFYPVDIPVVGSILALFSDYRNLKIYYAPQNFAFNLSARRNRNVNVTRPRETTTSQQTISRDFTASRGFNFAWKFTEGGFLNLSSTYNVTINSSLAYLETDAFERQRSSSEIFGDIFSGAFFGRDHQYQQNLDFRTAPKLPTLWDINKFFTINAGYSVNYQWNYDFRQGEVGRNAGYASKSTVGLTLRLKALSAPLFKEDAAPQGTTPPKTDTRGRGQSRDLDEAIKRSPGLDTLNGVNIDSLLAVSDTLGLDSDTLDTTPKTSALKNAMLLLKSVVQTILFDYESISFNFTNDNNLSKSGIGGDGTGLKNFWGVGFNDKNGPSRGFMVGLSSDVGRRAPNGNLSDNFSQKNNIEFKTQRPLWEGAKIDLNWKVGWSLSKSTSIQTDEFGNVTILGNPTSTGTLNRSFLSLPPVFFLSVFNSGITRVNELYNVQAADQNQALSDAFVQGFETLPFLSGLGFLEEFANYIPRPNWRITWDGLENFFLFKAFAQRVSLDHSYTSSYTEGWKLSRDGVKETQTQRIEYGFAPLAGLNFSFGEVWGGNLISSVKYSTRTGYDLGISTRNINENFSRDIGITAGYSKQGFELPLFGIALKNDIEFSFSYTSTKNSVIVYDFTNFIEAGTPQDGTTRTTMEPRIKYTISSKVTLSIFYRRSSVEPEGAARIPPTTTNEAGLDVHISIQ
jgi:cell surface protein SprA